MSEEVDYAEMLEIPVSTVNVVRRKNKRRIPDIKEKVIDQVNERMNEDPVLSEEEKGRVAESSVIDTPIQPRARWKNFFDDGDKKGSRILIGEFAAACLLCTTIFLTNIFMKNSAINTFMSGLFSSEQAETTDTRAYSDFTLTGIVNDYSDVSVEVSPTGVMSFTGEAAVYPVCDGIVESVSASSGFYTVVIAHSDSFESIVSGLSEAYYAAGESVKGNIPVGYSDGGGEVSVMLYDNDSLLNCFSVDSENCLSWNS